jgi:4-hydroxy-tetrahydrodipicolinate synthase
MLGNFIESNPGPVKFAMAAMGLCAEVYRLPMVSPRPASQEKMIGFLKDLGLPVVAGSRA